MSLAGHEENVVDALRYRPEGVGSAVQVHIHRLCIFVATIVLPKTLVTWAAGSERKAGRQF